MIHLTIAAVMLLAVGLALAGGRFVISGLPLEWANGFIVGILVGAAAGILYIRAVTGTRYNFQGVVDHSVSAIRIYVRIFFAIVAIGATVLIVQDVFFPTAERPAPTDIQP